MDFGNKICKIRKDNNLTQEEFAERYNVTRQTVSSWENCKSYPDLDTLVRISDDFSISLDVLLILLRNYCPHTSGQLQFHLPAAAFLHPSDILYPLRFLV